MANAAYAMVTDSQGCVRGKNGMADACVRGEVKEHLNQIPDYKCEDNGCEQRDEEFIEQFGEQVGDRPI
jgi:hypothetical protein